MIQIKENQILSSIFQTSASVPGRINHPFESDVEILDIAFSEGEKLALTVDIIAEEIEYGIYTDPFLIGWMSIIISLSDLAAAGAEPLGLLSIFNVDRNMTNEFISAIYKGKQAAAKKAKVPILGGDTNFTSQTQIGSVGIGKLNKSNYLTRVGIQPGDHLFTSGPLGMGNGFAFQKLFAQNQQKLPYLPAPRLQEASVMKKYATASIDTSDGFFPGVGQLLSHNPVGLEITVDWEALLPTELIQFNKNVNIPLWFYLAGPHGEFELLFTIPEQNLLRFQKEAAQINWLPIRIGSINESEGTCYYDKKEFPLEVIANAFYESDQSPKQYFNYLQKLLKKYQL